MQFLEIPLIKEALILILGAVIGWLTNRKRNAADMRSLEVKILQDGMQTLQSEIVEPLKEEIRSLRDELETLEEKYKRSINRLQNAINKMYSCPAIPNCPIRIELQKQQNGTGKVRKQRQPTNRQREPVDKRDDKTDNDTTIDGENESYT